MDFMGSMLGKKKLNTLGLKLDSMISMVGKEKLNT